MKKNKIILGILVLLFISLLGGIFYWDKTQKSNIIDSKSVSLGKCNINIETVATDESRKRGLSNRDSLCLGCGMFFLFDKKEQHYFWMKDMRFPIDIVWIADDRVVDINQNINQQSKKVYSSKEKVDKVLELNANDISRCGIKLGDKLKK